ncbi:hypothetical protein IS481_16900 [Caldimonas thermodepolymerans]|uniref:hypothetical protein n=1 Tax=Caldimonas thermodepolymerans TaxID=215580 RepID=UPI0011AFD4EF|nr:hypothetical protein [Caldimonas thermodepolymerans]QPC31375.1 hypothetical protein IS481_16900 [Caldimonas thermodepolymerans]
MDALRRRIKCPVLTLALFGATAVFAAQQERDGLSGRAVHHAYQRYQAARSEFERRVDLCMQAQRREVRADVFNRMGLSQKQQEVAAFVLSVRAVSACEAPAKGQLMVAYGVYRDVAQRAGVSVDPKSERYVAQLLERERMALEREVSDYANLSEELRQKLESIPELQQPFDFVSLLDRLRSRQ